MAWRKPASLHEWLLVLGRHKKKAIFPALTVAIIVVLSSFNWPKSYVAEAKFNRANDPSMDAANSNILLKSILPAKKMLPEELAGKPAIGRLVDDLGLTRDLPHTADGSLTDQGQLKKLDLVESIQSRVSVKFQTQSNEADQVIVSYSDADREQAPKVVNQLVESYLREARRKLDDTLMTAQIHFGKEVEHYRSLPGGVEDLEKKLTKFRMDNPGLLPDDPSSIQTKIVERRVQLQNISKDLEIKKAEKLKKEEWVRSQPDEIVKKQQVANPLVTQLYTQRAEIDKQLQELLAGGRTEEHPGVIKARQQLAAMDQRIAESQANVEGPTTTEHNAAKDLVQEQVATMTGTISALQQQQDNLGGEIDKFESLQRNFEVVRAEYVKLQRDLTDANEQLKFWEGQYNRITIALKTELGARGVNFQLTQLAEPSRPKHPLFVEILGAAVVLALGVATVVVLLAEVTDHSFRSVDHAVDDLKLPVLGAVTEIVTPAAMMRRKVMSWAVFPSISVAMVLVLLVSGYLVFMSLNETHRFDQLKRHPLRYMMDRATGQGG